MEVLRKLNQNTLRPCDELVVNPEEVIIRKRGRRKSLVTSASEAQADFAAAALLILETPGPGRESISSGGKRSRQDSIIDLTSSPLQSPGPRRRRLNPRRRLCF